MPWDRDGEHWQEAEGSGYEHVWRVTSGGLSSRGPAWVEVHRGGSVEVAWMYSERESRWYIAQGAALAGLLPLEVDVKAKSLRR